MTNPVFGLSFIQVNDQPQPVLGANLDVVGLIGPAGDADPSTFPINTPVLLFSSDTAKIAKLGTDGYLRDAINAINDQLADFEIAAQIVIVRTAYGTESDANLKLQQTIANIMGESGVRSGVFAFLNAPNALYCTPRLIAAPGYTGQMANSLDTLVTAARGIGYIPGANYQVVFATGNGETNGANVVLPVAHAVADSNGEIGDTELFIDQWGAWFTVNPTATLSAPDGSAITAEPALGQFIFSGQPGIGSTLTFNGTVVAFIAHGATPSGNQVPLGTDLSGTLTALLTFLNASSDTQLVKLSYTLDGGMLNFVNKTPGAAGNSFTLASTVTGVTRSGPTMSGGRDAASPTQVTLTATMALGANPIVASLTPVLNGLIAMGYVESKGTSYLDDVNWRDTINSQRIVALSGGVKVIEPMSGDIIVMPRAPREIGLQIARDFVTGYPFHSAANQPIQGIVGPARTIQFSLTDGATEGQQLLGANIGIVVRGLVGVETAISSGGFMSITTDNAGDDELWRMINVKRGRDYIHLSLMPALRGFLGRTNIDRQTVVNILTTINSFLSTLKARQQILGFSTQFQGALNSAEEIRLGHLVVTFAAEEPPVLKRITTMSARYRPAIDSLVAQLEQQLNLAA